MTRFEGFSPDVHRWFVGLEADNSKAYFAAHREFFEEAIRDNHGAELSKLVAKAENAGVEAWGDSLATAPRGYPKDHQRIELLRRKSLTLGATASSERGISRGDALRFVSRTWRAAAPVTGWLDEQVGASATPVDRRYRR